MSPTQIIQASAVAIGGRAIMIEGETGTGKSSLALALIDRGGELIGDDGVALTRKAGTIIASPPPNIAGKLEIRHVGIVEMPTTSAPLAIVLHLSLEEAGQIPRYIEMAEQAEFLGVAVPKLTLPARDNTLPLRAEWALKHHGI